MARLGRTQPGYRSGHSALGPPQVVSPVELYRPVEVSLAARQRRDSDIRREPHSVLRPPAVVPQPFIADPVSVSLVSDQQRGTEIAVGRRGALSSLRPPTVVDPVQVYSGPSVTLVPTRNVGDIERHRSSWKLSPPAVVDPGFIPRPVDIVLTEPHRPAPTHSKLRPPAVAAVPEVFSGPKVELARVKPGDPRWWQTSSTYIGPSVITTIAAFGGTGISLADARNARPDGRRLPHSKLSRPVVIPAVFIANPLRVALTRSHRPAATHSRLAPPTVVGPVQLYEPVDIRLAKVRQARPLGHWRLPQPAVSVPPVETTIQVALTRGPNARQHFAESKLRAPTVVGPVQVYGPPKLWLAPARKPRLVQSDLKPGIVAAGPPLDDTVDVTLAPSRDVARRLPKSELRAPTVVAPAVVYPSVATSLAPSPRQARAAHSELRPPQVVTEAFFARALSVNLGPSSNLARRTHPKLRPPAVVGPVQLYGPVKVELVPSPRQARGTHTKLRPPTVIRPFVAPALAVNLRVTGREIGTRRPVHPILRSPAVVTALSDVIYVDYYDHPAPPSLMSSSPHEATFDDATSGSVMTSSPNQDDFDSSVPIGEVDASSRAH